MLRRLHSIPVVATAHATKIQLHWCLNDHVIAVSDATRRFHVRYNLVAPWKITTVLNSVDTGRFQPLDHSTKAALRVQFGVHADDKLLGIVGNVIPRKGHEVAIKAMQMLLRQFPSAKLMIVGRGSDQEVQRLKQLANDLGVSHGLIWMGHHDDVAPLIGSLDVLLAPSLEEPFGLIAPEALACEVPVIASRLGGFLTTIQHDETGFLVKTRSHHELAAATERMLRNEDIRRQFGQAGRVWVKKHLAPNVHFAAVEQVLAKAALSSRRRALAKKNVA